MTPDILAAASSITVADQPPTYPAHWRVARLGDILADVSACLRHPRWSGRFTSAAMAGAMAGAMRGKRLV